MNLDSVKLELIDWIAQLKDQEALQKLLSIKNKRKPSKTRSNSEIFGSGKHLIESIADDFNEPLDVFNGYQK